VTRLQRALFGILIVAVGGCGSDPAPSSGPIALPPPVREAWTVPQPDGSIIIEAVSAPAVAGQPYVYPALMHCGITLNTFDFDGWFWAVLDTPPGFDQRDGNPSVGIDNPIDTGVIVLTAPNHAVWTSRSGLRFLLGRGRTEAHVSGCD
jgi:hypothetical protein